MQGLLRKFVQRGASVPAEVARWATDLPVVDNTFLLPRYLKAVANHASLLPQLSSRDAQIVAALEHDGVCVTSLDELGLPGTAEFLTAAGRVTSLLRARSRSAGYQRVHTVTATSADVYPYPQIFRWGLHDRLLGIAENYLRLPPAYDGFSTYYSIGDGREVGPRKWHRDREDRRMIKVGIYLYDVDEATGPFQLVRRPYNSKLLEATAHQYVVLAHRQVQEIVAERDESWLETCEGKAGTVIFADTARYFHRGKPPTRADRSAIYFAYISRRPQHSFLCERSPLTRAQIGQLVAGLSARHVDCASWTTSLPWWLRWIPKNRVTV